MGLRMLCLGKLAGDVPTKPGCYLVSCAVQLHRHFAYTDPNGYYDHSERHEEVYDGKEDCHP